MREWLESIAGWNGGRILRARRALVMFGLGVLHCGTSSANAQLQGKILRVGLSGGNAGVHLVRDGYRTPVDVQLVNSGSSTFSGTLLLEQADRDGDVAVASTNFVLQAGQPRPLRLYFVPFGAVAGQALKVTVRDERGAQAMIAADKGEPQREMLSNPMAALHEGELLLLEVNPSIGARLAVLQSLTTFGPNFQPAERRALKILPIQNSAIPDRWYGLEFADAMVWDNADVNGLEPEQMQAVVQWVFSGGRLLITGGSNWQQLAASPLAELLPVQIRDARQVKTRDVLMSLYGKEWPAAISDDAMVTRCDVEPRGDVLAGIWPYPSEAGRSAAAFRREYGRGVVTFVASPLRDLFDWFQQETSALDSVQQDGDDQDEPKAQRRLAPGEFAIQSLLRGLVPLTNPARASNVNLDARDLYVPVAEQVGFAQSSGLFVLFSILFSAGYALLATLGSWHWLKRRKWTHHAWSAFVVVAICSTGLGMTAVWGLRGFSRLVHDVQVVDGWANNGLAQAQCIFGLRTPRHMDVKVTLPTAGLAEDPQDDLGPISGLPVVGLSGIEPRRYVAPATYREEKDGRRLADVTVRATLKEFAGRWQGALKGQLEANLVSQAMTDRPGNAIVHEFVPPSFIRNNLPVDLRGCILLETTEDSVRQPLDVRVYPVGDLKKGEEFRAFGDWFRKEKKVPLAQQVDEVVDAENRFLAASQLPNLAAEKVGLRKWIADYSGFVTVTTDGSKTRSLGSAETALMLLSVFDLYNPEQFDEQTRIPLGRSFGRQCNITHRLSAHSAMLIGFSDESGPAVLHVDGDAIKSTRSVTMYRFLIPVKRQGQ